MKALLVILLGLYVNASYAQELDTTKVASRTKELDEVVVKASYLWLFSNFSTSCI